MRVIIYDAEENKELKILLPTDLIMNPLTAAIAAKAVNKKNRVRSNSTVKGAAEHLIKAANSGTEEEITDAAKEVVVESLSETAVSMNIDSSMLNEAFRTLKKFKKKHPELPIVDVYSSDGDRVTIMI